VSTTISRQLTNTTLAHTSDRDTDKFSLIKKNSVSDVTDNV